MKMKSLFVILLIIIVLVLSVLIIKDISSKNFKKENIKSIHYGGITGTSMYSNYQYDIIKKDNKYLCTIKNDEEEESHTFEIEEKDVKELEERLNDYKISKWNGFSKNDKRILDGYSFTLSINLENGKDVYAHGYMRYPKNYSKVSGYLTSYFNKLYERSKK